MRGRVLLGLFLVPLLAAGGCGGGGGKSPAPDAFSAVRQRPVQKKRRAAPHWVRVASVEGSGDATKGVDVARGAIQWRARFSCRSGEIRLFVRRGAGERAPLTRGRCPGRGRGESVRTGPVQLEVQARGRWRVTIEQQVDTALHERPLPAMSAPGARVVEKGRFYEVERAGRGTALLYRLGGGRLALRLQRFETLPNTDLFVWASRAARPQTTKQAAAARHVDLGPLKSTLGDENYLLPRSVGADQVRSIVIWCEPVQIAYTAATMRP